MSMRPPGWLAKWASSTLDLLCEQIDGPRVLGLVERIVATDRWNSFDRFHETTVTMADAYEAAGAGSEVHRIQTGGQTGTGRWVIRAAAEVRGATVDVVRPVRQRLIDWRENPWQVVQWSSATPRSGMTNDLVVVDTEEELRELPANALAGKIVLTQVSPYGKHRLFADKGAAGVIVESAVPNLPDATQWTKLGWGGVSIDDGAARLVGLAVSASLGKQIRELIAEHGTLTLRTRVDVRRCVGSHDVVSGLVWGGADPQDEVWALAHSSEPGAADNASGLAVCVEIARLLEALVAGGRLPRPKRTIRLLSGYECYGFFHYLEHVPRLQTPLAGVCIDTVGLRPELCDRRLEWHATIPMSASFVDPLGEAIVRAALRRRNPGYRCVPSQFVPTDDTLIGDPKYGFPCPWLTTVRGRSPGYDAYHSSADLPELLSPDGLEAAAVAMAAYLHFFADADTDDVARLAAWETKRALAQVAGSDGPLTRAEAAFLRARHHASMTRLQRWLWGGDRSAILSHLGDCERQVREAASARTTRKRRRAAPGSRRVPRRTAPITLDQGNITTAIAERVRRAGVSKWTHFWADGERSLADIAELAEGETGREADPVRLADFFEAHAELGYVQLVEPDAMVTKAQLVRDLRRLGLRRGMDVMVHSSLSSIGHVVGGAEAVIDALLAVIGSRGTLVMPSFNHSRAEVFNPLTTPTTNGAIAEAFWRRPEAVRSLHPSHAVAAIGPKAEALCAGHLDTGIWEQDSPIGRLVHGGGWLLVIGADNEVRTAYHVAENAMPCGCIDPFGTPSKIVDAEGRVRQVGGLAWRGGACPVSPRKLDPALDERGLQRRGRVGHADAMLVKAKDLWDVRREHLRDACPTCTVRPEAHRWPRRAPR